MLLEMFCTIRISDGIIFQDYIDNCGTYIDEDGKKKIGIIEKFIRKWVNAKLL
jgi:hypothetical protein